MKKIFFVVFMVFNFLVASDFGPKQITTTLLSQKNGVGIIADNEEFLIGSSGIVIHKLESGENSIVARCVVTQKDGKNAKIRFERFSSLKQNAYPIPKVSPKKGDEIIINFLYKRALLIAPNKEIYHDIIGDFPKIDFVDSDLAASYLSLKYKPNPSKDDFRKICDKYAAGLVMLATNKKIYALDCGSFKPIKEFPSKEIKSYKLPFFSNIGKIETVIWDFNNDEISNYDKYYEKLIHLKD